MTTDEALIITDVLCVHTVSYFLSPVYISGLFFFSHPNPVTWLSAMTSFIYLENMPLFPENSGLAWAGFTKLILLRFGNEMPCQE